MRELIRELMSMAELQAFHLCPSAWLERYFQQMYMCPVQALNFFLCNGLGMLEVRLELC